MIVLDENIIDSQRQQLLTWHIRVRQIGYEIARQGTDDAEIPSLLLRLRHPTFFTNDHGFYRRQLCHERYSIVWLNVKADETAKYARRVLKHPSFDTQAKRLGRVIRASVESIHLWAVRGTAEWRYPWSE
jgi:hypothetical protein